MRLMVLVSIQPFIWAKRERPGLQDSPIIRLNTTTDYDEFMRNVSTTADLGLISLSAATQCPSCEVFDEVMDDATRRTPPRLRRRPLPRSHTDVGHASHACDRCSPGTLQKQSWNDPGGSTVQNRTL
eukprot:Protomagalhaensia_wolfi_Nauph_80__674@NODE_1387_length_1551_cov_9_488095_g1073_i0_p2_GENE_NODE_1387_length_1551_cov_9_488095_g1073_i0NODE_1387_length_1551_cov_9_488095_g1073_i0_p2_ORF_typecomplete_len127_score10_35_NODE_1387_length_1551_cov_9_488095_g1073_i032412